MAKSNSNDSILITNITKQYLYLWTDLNKFTPDIACVTTQ